MQTHTCLAIAKADRTAANKHLPVTEDHKKLRAEALSDPRAGNKRGLIPQTQLSGAAASFLRYNTVSMVAATMAVRWLLTACMGSFGDFGILPKEDCIEAR